MGWLYTRDATKNDIIMARCATEENEQYVYSTLKHAVRGNTLWRVACRRDKSTGVEERQIACDRLSQSDGDWGYKDMAECEHPYYYDCPLRFLDIAPVANQEWRDKVRLYHKRARRIIQPGKMYELIGSSIPNITIAWIEPRRIIGRYNGTLYKVKTSMIGDEIETNTTQSTDAS